MVDAVTVHSAAESAAGYFFQCRCALLATIQVGYQKPNIDVSIERFDDVAFEIDGSPFNLIQTKHHVTRRGSLSNASVDLWKTLHIWTKQVREDSMVPSRTKFTLITTGTAPTNSAASLLRSTSRDEKAALSQLMNTAQESRSAANASSYQAFLDLSDGDREALIHAITIFDNSPGILQVESELDTILRPGAPVGKVRYLRERLEGWWYSEVIKALCQKQGSIPFTAIENKIDELRESFTRDALPLDFADIDPPPEIVETYLDLPFVQQLRLIKVGAHRIWFATRDYYRAFEQRSKWAREHLLVSNEISRYERQLIEAWEPRFEGMRERLNSNTCPEEKESAGGEIYKWAETVDDVPLRSVRAKFLCHGSFHMLANRCVVGWHPEFSTMIRSLGASSDGAKE